MNSSGTVGAPSPTPAATGPASFAGPRGTLFLDEVGDLPLSIQAKLLRAVEQGEIEPVGGDAPVRVDVRLVAATNQDLPRLMAEGRFRQDLYDRLAVLEIFLPPLRDRGGDIVLLARHFAQETARRYGRRLPVQFTHAALDRLEQHSWPGNVRELRNVITRAVLLLAGGLYPSGGYPLYLQVGPGEDCGGGSATRRSPSGPAGGA